MMVVVVIVIIWYPGMLTYVGGFWFLLLATWDSTHPFIACVIKESVLHGVIQGLNNNKEDTGPATNLEHVRQLTLFEI
jgi:hypothetical protein